MRDKYIRGTQLSLSGQDNNESFNDNGILVGQQLTNKLGVSDPNAYQLHPCDGIYRNFQNQSGFV